MVKRTVVGADLGGTKLLLVEMSVGLSSDGVPTSVGVRDQTRIPVDSDSPEVVEAVVEHTRKFIADVAERGNGSGDGVSALGLGVAGLVTNSGMVTRSPNVPGVLYQDLSGALEEATGIRTKVDNDANCVAVAAYVEGPRSIDPDPSDESGAGVRARPQGDQVVLAVTLGTGIGGGLVVDGTVLRGGDGYALEPGHMVVEPGGIQCRCGQQGCWERYASGTAIVGLATDAIEQGWTPERAKGSDALPGAAISSERIVELARSGDEVAMGITRQVGKWLAFGVQNLVGLLNPTWVVLGGGLAGEADLFLPAVHASVAGNPQLAGHGVSITVAPHGPAAGAVGAGIIAASA